MIKVNGPVAFQNDNQVRMAIDFWYRAGYSSAEGVFGAKQDPVCMNARSHEYMVYSDEDSDCDEDEKEAETDYKRRKNREEHRQRVLRWVHSDIEDILKEKAETRERQVHGNQNDDNY